MQKAFFGSETHDGDVRVYDGPCEHRMVNSDGTGTPLVREVPEQGGPAFGADKIRFGAGKGVKMHKHRGSHILFGVRGNGWVLLEREEGITRYWIKPGFCYLIESNVPHAIEAVTDLVLLAVGNDHEPAWSEKRMELC